jgi:outer membrane protein
MLRNRNTLLLATGAFLAGAFLLVFALRGLPQARTDATAPALRIAFVDTKKVFDEYTRTKEMTQTLEDAVKRLETDFKARQEEIASLESKLTKQRLFIDDPAQLSRMEEEIRQKKDSLRQLVQTGQQAIEEKQDELAEPILEEIRGAIREMGKQEGYSAILEKQLIVIYDEPGLDITGRVIAVLNERAAAQPPPQSQQAPSTAPGSTPSTGASTAPGTKK